MWTYIYNDLLQKQLQYRPCDIGIIKERFCFSDEYILVLSWINHTDGVEFYCSRKRHLQTKDDSLT